jgi:hypothetical protein
MKRGADAMEWVVMLLLLSLNAAAPAPVEAADEGKAPSGTGRDAASGAPKPAPGKPGDPLANLKPHEERRYRIDMQDCAKEKAADRRLCERSVQNRAEARSRRRGASGL